MNDINEYFETSLDFSQAYDRRLLVKPDTTIFGGAEDVDYVPGLQNIQIRIGRRPYAINLTSLFLSGQTRDYSQYAIFKEYDFCLLFQTISVMDLEGIGNLSTLGCKIRFLNEAPITVMEVMPKTEFLEIAKGRINVSLDASGSISMAMPSMTAKVINDVGAVTGARLEMAANADFKFNLSFNVLTPKIVAIGGGDNQSEWVFYKQDKPLTGTHQLVQLLMIRKKTRQLKFEVNTYGTVKFFGFATKIRNEAWFPLEVKIPEVKMNTGGN